MLYYYMGTYIDAELVACAAKLILKDNCLAGTLALLLGLFLLSKWSNNMYV